MRCRNGSHWRANARTTGWFFGKLTSRRGLGRPHWMASELRTIRELIAVSVNTSAFVGINPTDNR